MIVIGLTGSIGMGKSTLAAMFGQCGVPVHDADAEVHRLLAEDPEAFAAIRAAFPWYRYPQIYRWGSQQINRPALGRIVFKNPPAREKLENILHPLVRNSEKKFLRKHKSAPLAVLEIPLLFETGAENFVDLTLVATAPPHIQKQRVLARPGMDEKKFAAILARQMPDAEKRARADAVIPTGLGRAHTMKAVKQLIKELKKGIIAA